MNIDKEPSKTNNLVDWKQVPKLDSLKEELMNTITQQGRSISRIDRWLDLLNITGSVKRAKVAGRSNLQPKLIRKQLEWRIPTLTDPFLSTPDVFNVSGKTFEDVYAAKQNQLVLNYQFNTVMNKQDFIDSYIRTFATEGTAFLRVGWAFEERMKIVEVPKYEYRVPTQDDMFILQQAQALEQSDKGQYIALVPSNVKESLRLSMELGTPTFALPKPEMVEEEQKTVIKNHPTIDLVDYRSLYIDPNCGSSIEKAEFVIYAFDTSLDELKKAGIYSNLDTIEEDNVDLSALTDKQIEDKINFNFSDTARRRMTAYEYWGNLDIDGNNMTTPVVLTWIGDTFIRMEKNPYPDQAHPFVNARYIPVKNSVYGETDAELLGDTQAIYGATMRSMIDIMARTANGQKGIRGDMLDSINKRKYLKGDDFEYNSTVADGRAGLIDIKSAEIPQSAPFMLNLQTQEADAMSGIKSYASGIGSDALGDVATGIKGALDATSKRDLNILRRAADGLIKAGRKVIALNAQNLDETEVIRITEDDYVEVRRDDLSGNFDLELSISTAEEDDNKASQMSFILQTLGNSVPFELTKTVLAQIASLRKMHDLAKKLEDFKQEPDPLEVKKQELEIALLQAQVSSEQALVQERQADARLALARANAASVGASKTALDTIEQESGVTQEREKEKQQAQAQGNMQLELMKSALANNNNESSKEEKPSK